MNGEWKWMKNGRRISGRFVIKKEGINRSAQKKYVVKKKSSLVLEKGQKISLKKDLFSQYSTREGKCFSRKYRENVTIFP